jgi:hypothetical protein
VSTPSAVTIAVLAADATRLGCRILHEPATGSYFCLSERNPDELHRVTMISCACHAFISQGYCHHQALLLAELGLVPEEPDPEPIAPIPALALVPPVPEPMVANGHLDTSWLESEQFAEAVFALTPAATIEPLVAPVPVEPELPAPIIPIAIAGAGDRSGAMTATIDSAVEQLAAQLEQGYSAGFEEYLRFMSRFHQYSFLNCCLIKAQCPEASLVAGLKRWNELGFRVRAGERAIFIWAPLLRKVVDDETGDEVEKLIGFRPTSVFDKSQLVDEGKPFPTPFPALPDDAQQLYRLIRDRIVAAGIAVEEWSLAEGVEGVSKGSLILVNSALDSRRRVLVLLHELTHEVGHRGPEQPEVSRTQLELEAESVTFIVAAALGLDSPYSRDYIANWAGTAAELKASLSQIQKLARQVLAIVQPAELALAAAA